MFLERGLKMEINSKDELMSTLDEILSRLSVIEQSSTEKEGDKEKEDSTKDEQTEVESADEIEKLLNV